MTDRTYWHVPGARSWHAETDMWPTTHTPLEQWITSLCGRTLKRAYPGLEHADRIPPTAHLCGNCARVIAAQTDRSAPREVTEIVEPEINDPYEEHQEAAWQAAPPDVRALATVLHDADHDAAFCWYDHDCGSGGHDDCEERGGPKDHLDQARALVARGVEAGLDVERLYRALRAAGDPAIRHHERWWHGVAERVAEAYGKDGQA